MTPLERILAARADQLGAGHTAEADAARHPHELAEIGRTFISEAIDVLHPGTRRNLSVGIRRLAKGAAMILAAIERAEKEEA